MKQAYTILIVILVLTAVGILIITTVNFLGIDETKMSLTQKDSALGFYLSTACAEEALERVREDPTYIRTTWEEVEIHPDYSCLLRVINPNPPKYIYTRSEIQNFPRNLEIRIDKIEKATKRITIGYWLEK